MQHDYTDEEINEARIKASHICLYERGSWLKYFIDSLPARLPPIPKSLPPRPPKPEPKANQQEAIDAAFLDSRHICLWAVANSTYWEKEAPDRLALAQAYEQARPQSAELVELRAELDYARKAIEEKSAEIEALKAQPGPWPGQQEAIDGAFEQIDNFYLDCKSSCDDWDHEAPARLAIAKAYDAARPQAAEIASLKSALAESEKQFQDKVDEIARLLDECDKAQGILKACLSVMPFGNIETHTVDNLPGRIADLASELAAIGSENERLEAELASLREPAWIPHDGGPCPLKDEEVEEWEIKWRNGVVFTYVELTPSNAVGWDGGITAYRVLKWKPGFGPEAASKEAPATFEAHGQVWTRHTPGDPCPCDADANVAVLLRNGGIRRSHAREVSWFNFPHSPKAEIIGWRYADEQTQANASVSDLSKPADDIASKAYQYADYILNHYSKDSHADKLVLAKNLERHGWVDSVKEQAEEKPCGLNSALDEWSADDGPSGHGTRLHHQGQGDHRGQRAVQGAASAGGGGRMKTKVPYTQVELAVAERGGLSYNLADLVEAVKLADKEGCPGDKAPEFFEKMSQIRADENDNMAFLWMDFMVISQNFPKSWNKALQKASLASP